MLALPTKALILIPVIIDASCPQVENSLGARFHPTHTGLLHAVLNQMTARPFDDTATDRPAAVQVPIIVHIGQVASIVAHGPVQNLALGGRGSRVLAQAFQGVDDSDRLARQISRSCSFTQAVRLGWTFPRRELAASFIHPATYPMLSVTTSTLFSQERRCKAEITRVLSLKPNFTLSPALLTRGLNSVASRSEVRIPRWRTESPPAV